MMTLYKNENGKIHYWQLWFNDDESVVTYYSGELGQEGELEEYPSSSTFYELDDNIKSEISKKNDEGYIMKFDDEYEKITLSYSKKAMNFKKKEKLEFWLNELLGWSGLGRFYEEITDENIISFQCLVIDYPMAKTMIERDIVNTKFNNYIDIS